MNFFSLIWSSRTEPSSKTRLKWHQVPLRWVVVSKRVAWNLDLVKVPTYTPSFLSFLHLFWMEKWKGQAGGSDLLSESYLPPPSALSDYLCGDLVWLVWRFRRPGCSCVYDLKAPEGPRPHVRSGSHVSGSCEKVRREESRESWWPGLWRAFMGTGW